MNESHSSNATSSSPVETAAEDTSKSTSDAGQADAGQAGDSGDASRSFSPRNIAGHARLLAQGGVLAMREWLAPLGNPFLARALRIEERKHKPLLTLLGMALLAATLGGVVWWAWNWLRGLSVLGSGFAIAYPVEGSLPPALGGHAVGLAAMITLAAGIYSAVYATRARAAYLLRQELFNSTLDHLQMLPQPEERWVWWMSAHPMLLSWLIALAGLPVYALAILTGAWSVRDLIGVALLFTLLGMVAPTWQPQLWQQQQAKKSGKPWKVDWKALQQALKQEQAGAKQVVMTPAQQLEHNRRVQRMMTGQAELPTVAPLSEAETKTKKNPLAPSGYAAGGSGCSPWAFGWLGLQFFASGIRFAFRGPGGGGLSQVWHNFWGALPPEATSLIYPGGFAVPLLLLSWPLLLARILLAPLPFFAFAVPPALLIVPLWLGLKIQGNQMLASNVSARETFWTEQRANLRSRIGIGVLLLLWALLAGFGWISFIEDGLLIALLRGAPPLLTTLQDWAVAALWTLLLFLGVVLAGSAQEKPVTLASQSTSDSADVHPPQVWRASAAAIALSMGGVLAVYFVSCWLGGTSGVNAAWLSRLGATLALAGGYLLADWGSGALQVALPPEARGPWRTFRQLWFQGLGLITLILLAYFAVRGREFSFNDAPVVLLSPWVTMISLFRYDIAFPPLVPGVAWSMWWPPLIQAALGLACWTFARALLQRRGDWAPTGEEEKESFVDKLLWPLRMMGKTLSAIALAVLNGFEALQNFIRRQNDRIADRTIKLFNPVLTDELRRRLHREHWLGQWVLLMISGVVMLYLFGDVRALLAGAISLSDWGMGVVITTLVLSLLIGFSALLLGKAFDRERANGTLVFLFLTPLTDHEIVRGKWLPGLVHAVILLAAALPWLVLGSVEALLGNEINALWVALGGLLVLLIHWLWVATASVLFAVRARKPGEGIGKALLVIVLSYACTLFVTLWLLRDSTSSEVDALRWPIAGVVGTLFLMLSWAAWRGALSSLKHQRYSDSALRGKGAS